VYCYSFNTAITTTRFVSKLLIGIKPSASQSQAPLQAAVCESDVTPCPKVDLVHGNTTALFAEELRQNRNGWQAMHRRQ